MTRHFIEITYPTGETRIEEVNEGIYKMIIGENPAPWFSVEKVFGAGAKVRVLTYQEAHELGLFDYSGR